MENYKKMMEEGWISQTVIQEKLAQRRRTARTRYQEDRAALERVYQEKINQAKEELRKKINTLEDMLRQGRAAQRADRLNEQPPAKAWPTTPRYSGHHL